MSTLTNELTSTNLEYGEPVIFFDPDSLHRFRITVEPDEDAESPRDWGTVTSMFTWDADYTSPDFHTWQTPGYLSLPDGSPFLSVQGYYRRGDGAKVSARHMSRYLNLLRSKDNTEAGDVIAFAFLYRNRAGLTLDWTGTDPSVPFPHYANEDEPDGVVLITRALWEENMGDADPTTPTPTGLNSRGSWVGTDHPDTTFVPSARQVIEQEVVLYNQWANGEFRSFTVEEEVAWARQPVSPPVAADLSHFRTNEKNLGGVYEITKTWEHVTSLSGLDSFESAVESLVETLELHGLTNLVEED